MSGGARGVTCLDRPTKEGRRTRPCYGRAGKAERHARKDGPAFLEAQHKQPALRLNDLEFVERVLEGQHEGDREDGFDVLRRTHVPALLHGGSLVSHQGEDRGHCIADLGERRTLPDRDVAAYHPPWGSPARDGS